MAECVWRCVGEQFADVNFVNRVPHGGGRVMVLAGISYGQRTQLHFIDGNFNAQRYCDEILRPIAIHPPPSTHISEWKCMAPCRKDLYTIPGSWKYFTSSMACIIIILVTHWAGLGCSRSTCTTACSSFHQCPITSHSHWRGVGQLSTGHNQQPDQLYAKGMLRCMWQILSHQILTGFLIHVPTLFFKVSVTNRCISVVPVID